VLAWLQSLPPVPATVLAAVLPAASDDARDLVARLLGWDPEQRLSAAHALAHPFLADHSDPTNEVRDTRGPC
jgi:serine/threonine protein kinase